MTSPGPVTGDNEFTQLQYAIKALAQLGNGILNCARAKPEAVDSTRHTYAGLQRALDFQVFHINNLLATFSKAAVGNPAAQAQVSPPAQKILDLGNKCVTLVKEFTPNALTILNSVPHGSDRSAAQAVLPSFLKLAAEFRDSVLELSRLADSVEAVGVAIFANSGLKFPVVIGKLGGKNYLGNYWQWRSVEIIGSTLFSWPHGDDSKKSSFDLSGGTFLAITMHSDPKTWLKLTKFKCDSAQGFAPITNPAFIKCDFSDKDKAKYLLVPSPDVEKWIKVFGHAKCAKPAASGALSPKAVQFGAPTVVSITPGQPSQPQSSISSPIMNGRPPSGQLSGPVVDNRRSMAPTSTPIVPQVGRQSDPVRYQPIVSPTPAPNPVQIQSPPSRSQPTELSSMSALMGLPNPTSFSRPSGAPPIARGVPPPTRTSAVRMSLDDWANGSASAPASMSPIASAVQYDNAEEDWGGFGEADEPTPAFGDEGDITEVDLMGGLEELSNAVEQDYIEEQRAAASSSQSVAGFDEWGNPIAAPSRAENRKSLGRPIGGIGVLPPPSSSSQPRQLDEWGSPIESVNKAENRKSLGKALPPPINSRPSQAPPMQQQQQQVQQFDEWGNPVNKAENRKSLGRAIPPPVTVPRPSQVPPMQQQRQYDAFGNPIDPATRSEKRKSLGSPRPSPITSTRPAPSLPSAPSSEDAANRAENRKSLGKPLPPPINSSRPNQQPPQTFDESLNKTENRKSLGRALPPPIAPNRASQQPDESINRSENRKSLGKALPPPLTRPPPTQSPQQQFDEWGNPIEPANRTENRKSLPRALPAPIQQGRSSVPALPQQQIVSPIQQGRSSVPAVPQQQIVSPRAQPQFDEWGNPIEPKSEARKSLGRALPAPISRPGTVGTDPVSGSEGDLGAPIMSPRRPAVNPTTGAAQPAPPPMGALANLRKSGVAPSSTIVSEPQPSAGSSNPQRRSAGAPSNAVTSEPPMTSQRKSVGTPNPGLVLSPAPSPSPAQSAPRRVAPSPSAAPANASSPPPTRPSGGAPSASVNSVSAPTSVRPSAIAAAGNAPSSSPSGVRPSAIAAAASSSAPPTRPSTGAPSSSSSVNGSGGGRGAPASRGAASTAAPAGRSTPPAASGVGRAAPGPTSAPGVSSRQPALPSPPQGRAASPPQGRAATPAAKVNPLAAAATAPAPKTLNVPLPGLEELDDLSFRELDFGGQDFGSQTLANGLAELDDSNIF